MTRYTTIITTQINKYKKINTNETPDCVLSIIPRKRTTLMPSGKLARLSSSRSSQSEPI